jgi:hypothetical protein
MYFHDRDPVSHEAEITIKDGVPCLSPVSDAQVRKEQVGIITASFGPIRKSINGVTTITWFKTWDTHIFLSGDECIPYGGDTPLEENTLYGFSLGVYVPSYKPLVPHEYGATFCLLEDKDGETVIWQAQSDEYPTSCPANSEDVPTVKPGDNKSQPQNANLPKEE